MLDNQENTFHFSSEDVGCKIICVVSHQENINDKQEEWLSFGPIELAPFIQKEIEENIIGRSCQYSGYVHVNKKGKINNSGIQVNTKNQMLSDSLIKDNKLFKPKYYSQKMIMNSNTLFLEIGYNLSLEEKREQYIQAGGIESYQPEIFEMSLNLEDFRLETNCNNYSKMRMYWMEEIPQKLSEMELIHRDPDNGMFYLDIEFTERSEKEAFYVTHRMIRGITKLSLDEALRRFEFRNKAKGKSKLS